MDKLNFDFSKIKDFMNLDVKDLKIKLLKGTNNIKKNSLKKREKKRKVVAFDMGSKSIKITEGTYYKGNLTIDKFIEFPTPEGAIIDGFIEKRELLVTELGKVLKQNGISAKEATCTNNSSLIINRELMIPEVQEDELETVVRYEIQQYLPINLDDYILQITLIGEEFSDSGKKLEIRAIAYPEKMARGYYDFLKALNLKPFALDVNYNAVNKLINYIDVINQHQYKKDDSVAFIDMGATTLDVNIYNKGILKFTRIIKTGGVYLDEILYESGNIPLEEIQDFKISCIDLEKEDLNPQNELIKSTLDEWIDKIEKIIGFYKSKNFGDEVDKVFIHGGTSRLKGLEEYMTLKLGIETIKVKELPQITLNSNNDSPKNIDKFVNVIGSLIRL
ncbi:hypothetical protein UT300005_15940 [Clostridium sp. CTA-5]